MSSTRRMAFCHSLPMKITVRATQREKLFNMHEDLVTKRSEYSKDLFVRPYSGRTYESLFHGAQKLRAIASRKREVLRLLWMPLPAPSGRRWECLSACLGINITSSTPTNWRSTKSLGTVNSTCPTRIVLSKALVVRKIANNVYGSPRCVRLFVVRLRNPVSSSVISIYLRSELTLIDTKILSARCPLADVLGSVCGTPPPCHLDVCQDATQCSRGVA